MKKKFGLFALVLGLLLACSLFLFAACGDGDKQTGDEVTISVTVNGAAQTNGGTYNATVGTEYTIAATASDDSEVEVRYVFGDAAAVEVTDGKFTPQTAGDYAFTFTAEGAENFTLTVKAAAQTEPEPAAPVITASADKTQIEAGGQVTLTWSATENAQVSVTYTKNGTAESALQPVSGTPFTISEAGKYVFTFAAEGAESKTVTVTVTEAQTEPPKHTHVWDAEWTIAAPTETKAGKASRACVASGCTDPVAVQELELPALGSEEAKTFYEVTVKTPATCTTAEVSTYTWVKNDTVTFDVTGEVSYAQSAHTALTYVAAKAATCTEAGTIAHAHCSACGNYYTVTGDASSYTIGEEIADGANGLTNTEDLAKGHSYAVTFDSEEEYTTALGTGEGRYPVQCANCTEEVTITLPALTAVNTWTKSDEVSATCTAAGTATFTAEVNDVTVVVKGVQTDPAKGHSYTATLSFYGDIQQADQPFPVTCSSCEATKQITIGFVDPEAWQWEPETVTEATCTSSGEGKVTLTVTHEGNSYTVYLTDIAIDPLGHDYAVAYENNTVTATCGRDGCDSVVTATVTIDGNEATGGSTALDASAFRMEGDTVTVTLPGNGFERDGYTFKGWGQEADGASGVRQPGDEYSVEGNGTLTIYAVWTNAPVISLEVKLGGAEGTPISIPNGATIGNDYAGTGTDWVCVGTTVAYTASVTGGGTVSVSYSYSKDDSEGEPTPLDATDDAFVFENAGTYVFTIGADGAEEYTFTVIVTEHVYGEWRVATQPTAETEGELQRDCLHCSIGQTEASMQTVRMPAVTEQNIGDEDGKYSAAVTAPGCETEGKTEYSFNYGGQKFPVDYEVTTPAAGHTYGAASVDAATGNIVQTCTVCSTATKTAATLTGLSVAWAESAQGWYTVGGAISASDFVVTYTYDVAVEVYDELIAAAITNDITNTDKTAATGIKTVTFTLGGQSASIDVMVYAANETNGAKVLQNKMGTAVSALGTAYDVAAISDAATNGFAVSFWKTGDTDNDWSAIVTSGKGADGANGFDITLPNLDPFDYGGEWAGNAFPSVDDGDFHNGGTYDDFILGPAFITVSVNTDGSIAYYLNGVLKIKYQSTKAMAVNKTVGEFVSILLNDVQSYGFALGSTVANSGVVGDDLFVTSALTDAQAAAMFKAYQMPQLNTAALMNGIEEEVFASSYAASVYKAEAISGVAESGLSISFNLIGVNHGTNPQATDWDDIILGTNVELDVCLGVLDAWANTSASMAGDFNCYTPSYGNASYFRTGTEPVSGYVTVTLTKEGSIVVYHNREKQIEYASTVVIGTHTVATMVNAIFAEIAANSFDVCEGVDASELLLTAALDELQAQKLYDNWQGLNA